MRAPLSPIASLVVVLAVVIGGCDSITGGPQTVTFQGVEVEAVGGTELSIENGRLVVSGVENEGDGIGLWRNYDSADLKITPIELASGQRFGTSVRDTDDRFVASVESRGRGEQSHDIVFDVADRFGVQVVTLQYLLGTQLVFEIPNVRVGSGGGLKLRAETDGGSGKGKNGSTRVIRDGGRYVVGQDYSDDSAPLTRTEVESAVAKGECPFAIVTLPPVVSDVADVCVDLVQVVIEDESLPRSIRGVAVTGASLDSFEIRTVRVEGG
ncbi:MAG: hypothetical protein AAGI52_10860 [Bacteroidota bacterium]